MLFSESWLVWSDCISRWEPRSADRQTGYIRQRGAPQLASAGQRAGGIDGSGRLVQRDPDPSSPVPGPAPARQRRHRPQHPLHRVRLRPARLHLARRRRRCAASRSPNASRFFLKRSSTLCIAFPIPADCCLYLSQAAIDEQLDPGYIAAVVGGQK
jgi:hypothetical protein